MSFSTIARSPNSLERRCGHPIKERRGIWAFDPTGVVQIQPNPLIANEHVDNGHPSSRFVRQKNRRRSRNIRLVGACLAPKIFVGRQRRDAGGQPVGFGVPSRFPVGSA